MTAQDDPWRNVASEFAFVPGLAYLNTGSEGSMPRRLQAVLGETVAQWAASPSQAFFNTPRLDTAETVNRARLAAFTGATPGDIVLTDNTSTGLAMVLLGAPLSAGDEVITTQHDHFSMFSPLYILSQRFGVKAIQLPLPSPPGSAQEIVAAFEAAITPRTKAICFSHITYTTGLRMPVKALCTLARERSIMTLVDGAHALGMLDLDLDALGCDFYSSAGHKWLNGPPGTGILYLRDASANPWGLVPILSEKAMAMGPGMSIADALQKRGELDGPAFYTLARTCDFVDAIGKPQIEQRILDLSDEVRARAVAMFGPDCLFSVGADGGDLRSGLVAFVPSRDREKARDAAFVNGIVNRLVRDHGIWVLCTAFPGPDGDEDRQFNALRVSTSLYNSRADLDRLFDALTLYC